MIVSKVNIPYEGNVEYVFPTAPQVGQEVVIQRWTEREDKDGTSEMVQNFKLYKVSRVFWSLPDNSHGIKDAILHVDLALFDKTYTEVSI
uniref:Uncharacterized protein n=1 Tax=Ochrobactrum phage ORM_20 TaxID=2985243 RepID=A0A9N6X039_9VIRU|nr:hypothetical protein ORM20_00245 [Ochrobactrum phage ORM_20]